ncbi:GNAT family N-acetyltransferase [Neogemmobacter tilapiae]|uniref:N-acetyltransferase n=1 Tax=Neogemmobacter tilapiae TaxID=875041 RepID=A0A918WLA7_9RHOB|nr:GNAT family N-acetyltransferase [Gemmobacter tilapiae]GHC55905.1 N-acetyltransferase [Gemmobacter tilapiae]
MIRPALPSDQSALESHLLAHVEGAMFPLANLRAYGFTDSHPHAMRFWLGRGALGLSQSGMVMPCFAPQDAPAFAATLKGETLTGLIGPADQTRPLIRALGLQDAPCRVNKDEPGFELVLDRLILPDTQDYQLRSITPTDLPQITAWRIAYHLEILGTPASEARQLAEQDIAHWLPADSHRILFHNDQPVALTGFNARLPEIVQIGGVYTPPERRAQGHARRAVALHLAEARKQGVARAVLFAASDKAARAYAAIGFSPRAAMALVLFQEPQKVPL